MTEPKHEEQGECVAGQFRRDIFHRCLGSVSYSLGVQVESGLLQRHVLTTAVMKRIMLWLSEGPLYLKSSPGFHMAPQLVDT